MGIKNCVAALAATEHNQGFKVLIVTNIPPQPLTKVRKFFSVRNPSSLRDGAYKQRVLT